MTEIAWIVLAAVVALIVILFIVLFRTSCASPSPTRR
jgi:hypothetical protein